MRPSSSQPILITGGHVIDPGRSSGMVGGLLDAGRGAARGAHVKAPSRTTTTDAQGRIVPAAFGAPPVPVREPVLRS